MAQRKPLKTLRIGMIGAGFIARFHLESFTGVRNCAITGVYSPTKESRTALAKRADELGLGPCTAHASLDKLIQAKDVDALWILSPNDTRVATMQAIHKAVKGGKRLRGIACEKPLARNLAEARAMVSLADDARLATGYLENQVFSTAVERGKEIIWRRAVPLTGRPYLARAAEEHSGPHMPWFWQGEKQGGGVLSDMMCHSVEVARHMLTAPDEARDALTVKSVNATVANLKWTRPAYVRRLKREMGREVDYGRRPAEDFARGTLVLEDPDGNEAMIETTTSWAYVGAGLRIQLELLGPEYSMEFSSLGTGLKVFISRAVKGAAGEDLVEKQNAEQGLMPALEDEAGVYGYTSENRHMVECFRTGVTPSETFRDGFAVTEILMALYRSAELGARCTSVRRTSPTTSRRWPGPLLDYGVTSPLRNWRRNAQISSALSMSRLWVPDHPRQASGRGSRLGQLWPPPSTRSSLTALSGSAQPVQTTSRTRLPSLASRSYRRSVFWPVQPWSRRKCSMVSGIESSRPVGNSQPS